MSEIHVQCQCGQRFAADADRAGQTLACPVCSSPIHVPPAVHAMAAPPIDVWHGRLADGQLFGPVSRAQLDETAASGRLGGEAELWQQGEPAPIRADDLYPELKTILPVSSNPAAGSTWTKRAQQDLDHLASNPIGYLVGGPKRPRYQRQKVGVGWNIFYLLLLLILGGAGTVLLGITGIVRLGQGDGEASGLAAAMLLLLFGGIFALSGSLFQWRFFFESRKAIGARDLMGDRGARYFYILVGTIFVIAPYAVATVTLVGTFASEEPAERPPHAMESQVRTWKIKSKDRVEVFQGTLRQVSGTGATILREGQIVGAKFENLSPADRQYLREVFVSRGQGTPGVLYAEYDVDFDPAGSPPNNNRRVAPSSAAGWEPGQPLPLGGVKVGVPRVPAPTPGFDRPPPVDPALPLEQRLIDAPLNVGKPDELLIAGTDPPLAYALERALRETTLRIFDLRSGKLHRQYVMPYDSALVAAAPDGSRVVLAKDRIHDETLLAVRLGEEVTVEAEWQPNGSDGADWIRFATPDRLFSATARDVQTCWAWPPARPLIEFERAYPYEFTPGGRFFIERVIEGLQFRNTSDGQLAGGLHFERGLTTGAFSVSRDGTRLIANIGRENSLDNLLGCWDLKTGNRMFLIPFGPAAGSYQKKDFFRWLGPDYVLCGDLLACIPEQRVVWRFTRIPPCLDSPDDRLWAIGSYGNEKLLMPRTIPDAELVAKFQPPSPARSIVAVGDKVSLDIDFQAAPPSAEMRSQLQAAIEQKMHEAGWQVAAGQPRKVRAVIREQDEGGTVVFAVVIPGTKTTSGLARPTGETIDVPNIKLVCALELLGEGGKRWQQMQVRSGPNDVPDQQRQRFQKLTPEIVLGARWDALVERIDYMLEFKSEILLYEELATSPLAVPVSHDFMAKQAEIRRAEQLAEIERNKPKIELPWTRESVPWRVEPDPHPALLASALRRTMPIAAGDVKGVRFAPEAGQVIIHIDEADDDAAPHLHRFDLRNKKRLARTPLPAPDAKLLDFRPDGQVWLIQPTPSENTLQVWRSVDGQDLPFVDVKLTEEQHVRQAFFLGRGGLLVDDGQHLIAQSLPAGELVYRHQLASSKCHLSWGRRYFVDWSGSRFALYQTADGTLAGQLASLPSGSGSTRSTAQAISLGYGHVISDAAFHPDGGTLALLVGTTIGIWDLRDGSLAKWIDVPTRAKAMQWCGPKYLLVDDNLFDLDWEAPIWSYSGLLPESPDGRGWFLAEGQRNVTHLAAIALPSEYVKGAINKIKARVPPLVIPGEGVSLQISVSGVAERRDELTARLERLFTEQLTAKKLDVRDGERSVLRASYSNTTDGRDAYRFKQGATELIVENRLLQARVSLSRGSSQWQKYFTVDLASVDYVIDSESSDPAGELLKQQEEHMFGLLRRLSPPVSLPPMESNGFGQSRCDISGEQATADIRYRF